MSLTTVAGTGKTIARQVALRGGSGASVLYTVPVGKTFVGTLFGTIGFTSDIQITAPGQERFTLTLSSGSANFPPTPITLLEGTILTTSTSNGVVILGTES